MYTIHKCVVYFLLLSFLWLLLLVLRLICLDDFSPFIIEWQQSVHFISRPYVSNFIMRVCACVCWMAKDIKMCDGALAHDMCVRRWESFLSIFFHLDWQLWQISKWKSGHFVPHKYEESFVYESGWVHIFDAHVCQTLKRREIRISAFQSNRATTKHSVFDKILYLLPVSAT